MGGKWRRTLQDHTPSAPCASWYLPAKAPKGPGDGGGSSCIAADAGAHLGPFSPPRDPDYHQEGQMGHNSPTLLLQRYDLLLKDKVTNLHSA